MDEALRSITESAYGCAGERCLAGSVVLAVGDCHDEVRDGLAAHARALVVGDGSKDDTSEHVAPGVYLMRLPFNLGIGGAMQAGYRFARDRGYDVAIQVE